MEKEELEDINWVGGMVQTKISDLQERGTARA
jgi:hypothetical protein